MVENKSVKHKSTILPKKDEGIVIPVQNKQLLLRQKKKKSVNKIKEQKITIIVVKLKFVSNNLEE